MERDSPASLIDLTGKVAVVTGGAMGIGRAIAERLHQAGAAVTVADVDGDAAGALAAELDRARPGSASAVTADVSVPADAEAMVQAAVSVHGQLDILVNNAGIFPIVPFMEMDLDAFERVVRVNLVGTFLGMKAGAARMVEQGHGGRIVNVTSVDALHPSMVGLAHYDASKHGVWGLTKNVALELAEHGIAVNALAPGGVVTPGTHMVGDPDAARQAGAGIPMGRMADPDEMGRVALFLASDLSSYLTGSQVVADGGLLLR